MGHRHVHLSSEAAARLASVGKPVYLQGSVEVDVDLARADAVLGTSVGALVGAFVSGGRDATDALTSLAALGQSIDSFTWRQAMKRSLAQ